MKGLGVELLIKVLVGKPELELIAQHGSRYPAEVCLGFKASVQNWHTAILGTVCSPK